MQKNQRDQATGEFRRLLAANPNIEALLEGVRELEIPDCWLASGALVQTIWNARHGFAPTFGIKDYDLIYFNPDTSWDKENAMIDRVRGHFRELGIEIEIRNQARVPLWYRDNSASTIRRSRRPASHSPIIRAGPRRSQCGSTTKGSPSSTPRSASTWRWT